MAWPSGVAAVDAWGLQEPSAHPPSLATRRDLVSAPVNPVGKMCLPPVWWQARQCAAAQFDQSHCGCCCIMWIALPHTWQLAVGAGMATFSKLPVRMTSAASRPLSKAARTLGAPDCSLSDTLKLKGVTQAGWEC